MKIPRLSEDDLCRLFAEKIASSDDFKNWFLFRTKFASRRFSLRLLREEQALARPRVRADRWWRHWFWRIAALEKEHETDVLLWFVDVELGKRVVVHVEFKQGSKLSPGQAASYAPRARHVMKYDKRIPHDDFATVFVASAGIVSASGSDAVLFDAVISLEEIGIFITEFGSPAAQVVAVSTTT
ncbi:MAG: hypothetical protein VX601_00490 [Pseudomonadota bacterium]|nr:hypothetical protein [Pseudomonadota bacterium]